MTLAHTRQAAAPAASAGFLTARARPSLQAAAMWLARRSKTAQAKGAGNSYKLAGGCRAGQEAGGRLDND